MLSICHISDLHFGPPYLPEVGERLRESVQRLAPQVIVASGDFTQRATPEQFAAARAYLDTLPAVPTIVTPGNHDVPVYRVWERLTNPYGNYRQHISSELDTVTEVPGAVFVALNSMSPYTAITNGRIHERQLDFAAEVLSRHPDETLKVVVAHHHFAPAPDYEQTDVMPKAKRALDRFAELGVDMILGGHLHRAYIGNSLDIYAGKQRDRGITIVQCGTSTSRRGRAREREKNSFNYIQASDSEIVVTHQMFLSKAGNFEAVGQHRFPRWPHRSLTT
ncbi:metallophosphoesterase [Aeoliella sp. ICT_H6.2]|uniref:Metallophosphoesterase n=1 Tax=Aeoliella straminimaris TaxID=2954799 RepID=A0A9X2FDM4_9BACT|nr:metallophosphoesterase family protein [Aeoliella straminimaris]MCO6047147.1 metallophosphoesterase [Aeoliella straminimaris]